MRLANTTWLKELVSTPHESPCISMYLPMYRSDPSAAENNRRFRDQIGQVRTALGRQYSGRQIDPLIQKIESIPGDADFWRGDRDGIAIFASPDFLRVIDLREAVDEAVFVADTFHVKPLLRILQSAWKFHVLTFTQRKVEVFEGTGSARLQRLDSANLPQNADIVSKMRMSHQVSATQDMHTSDTQYPNEGTAPNTATLENFMRAVDKAVWENFSRDTGYPMILCAVEHYHAQFHAISKNTSLLEEGIKHDPQHLDPDRIRQEAWAIIEPRFRATAENLKNQFMAAKARQRGSDELRPVAEAAAVGRVDTLLVDATREIPGQLDRTSGNIMPPAPGSSQNEDVLDDLAEMVLKTDGEVLILPPEMMPGGAEIAAIYRY